MRVISTTIFLIFTIGISVAQDKEMDKLYNKARAKYATGHFEEARDTYITLLKKKPTDFVFNYELGLLFFYELNNKTNSIPYFETAQKVMKDTVADLFNYLGQAYQSNLEYDKAIESFNTYSAIPPKEGVIRVSVKRYIDECRKEKARLEEIQAKRSSKTNDGLQVINLGPVVNSENDDVSPILLENKLIFTSSRMFDYVFDEFIKHSYQTEIVGDKYSKPSKLSELPYLKELVVDPNWHQEITAISENGQLVSVIYENSIWTIDRKGKNWAAPDQLSRKINRSKDNAYAALSTKGDRMVVVLFDKKSGKYDLYQTAKKTDGTWNDLIKLNDNINTSENEHYPSFSEDGYTLNFSSDRPGGNGGYDIYESQLEEDNQWGTPKRLDPPINSDGNDITYKRYKSINKDYFSSDRKGGFGKYDIYEVNY